MRVLVTGAFGYVGHAVVRRLATAGYEVVGLSRQGRVPHLAGVRTARADILDARRLGQIVAEESPAAVCHLAALTRVRDSFREPLRYFEVNVQGTINLLSALDAASTAHETPARLVFASTAAVYGAPERQPIHEDQPPAPTNPYGASKLAADQVIGYQCGTGRLGAVSLRCFNVAGAVDGRGDTDETRIIPKALAVAAGRAPHLEVNGDGTAVREFVHVDDLAAAYVLALQGCEPGRHQVFNVGSGTGVSVLDVIAAAEAVTGRPLAVLHRPPQPEPPVLLADSSRIRDQLAWCPERSDIPRIIADAWGGYCDATSPRSHDNGSFVPDAHPARRTGWTQMIHVGASEADVMARAPTVSTSAGQMPQSAIWCSGTPCTAAYFSTYHTVPEV
ncbi:MAG: NAD-dependent epimerase/dehydratase family protein [Streptomycetales bacterium]